MEAVDAVVIGAGAVGLACARELALAGREVLVLEEASAIGTGTSARNSEVVHAGIYYPPGSLKAQLCVEGNRLMYDYCRDRGVSISAVGKLIVATAEAQIPRLEELRATAERNGVRDLVWLSQDEATALEPAVRCVGGLFSPSSGIVDSHGYMTALRGDLEAAGGMIAFRAPVLGGEIVGEGGIRLSVGGAEPMALAARTVVNAAGLNAPDLARSVRGLPPESVPRAYLAKGNYFSLSGVKSPFRHLVYPMPEQAGLGIHATIDLAGQVKFGPDVQWVDAVDYAVDESRRPMFEAAVRSYWPDLPDSALAASYAGIRPKIVGPGAAAADFVIQGPAQHGVEGLWNLFGIESPGLTASLAIARHLTVGALAAAA